MKKLITLTLVAVATWFSTNEVWAERYRFSGVVNQVDAPLASNFKVGELITGNVTITPATRDDSGLRGYALSNFYANIGGHYPITMYDGGMRVFNNWAGVVDQLLLEVGPVAANVNGHVAEYLTIHLNYPLNALSSTQLIKQFVISSPLDRSNLRFDGNDAIEVQYRMTDFSQVPEPSSLLAALVLGGLGICATSRMRVGRTTSIGAARRR
jgi:hypothetical protein